MNHLFEREWYSKMYVIKNLTKKYGKLTVLDNISFEIEKADIVSIIGVNGAGKTTLVKLLTRLIIPTDGEIYYEGCLLKNIKRKYYNDIGVVLEGDRNIYWYMTGMENIMYFGRLNGLCKSKIIERSKPLINLFNLTEDINRNVGEYSRGMKQKLGIIIALINNPKVLFLDEPTLGLDLISKKDFIEQIRLLNREKNITIIITSHEFDFIEQISNKLILINENKIEQIENIPEFINKYFENKYSVEIENNEFLETIIKTKSQNIQIKPCDGYTKIIIVTDNFIDVMQFVKKLVDNNVRIIKCSFEKENLESVFLKIWGKERGEKYEDNKYI